MRYVIGARGVLAKDLPTLCCSDVIPAGCEVEIYALHSPKRVWIQEYPERCFLHCGHSSRPADGDMERFDRELKAMPQSGPIGDLANAPKMCPIHKVKASKIWFDSSDGEDWKRCVT